MSTLRQGPVVAVDGHVELSRDDFADFVSRYAPTGALDWGVYLEPLLAGWLFAGLGIESTAAQYDHFLQVVVSIIDAILKSSLSLNYRGAELKPHERRMIGLQDPTLGANVLSRMGYDQVVHQTLEGRRSEELRSLLNH
ncbi:hypothetical protein GA0115240_110710 [Streptomyces sp. DvalAA-14]|nr:hypothetical protein GA0115240_110710 [Streptomyces sp. DvalAA-14]